MKDYKKTKKRSRRWPLIVAIVAIVALIGLGTAVLVVRQGYTNNLKPVNTSSTQDVVVAIPTGSSIDQIAEILKGKDVIKSTWAFKQYIRSNELSDKLQAGTYRFKQSMSVQQITDDMVNGKVAVDLFTILPDQRLDQVKAAFVKAGFAAADVDKALDPAQYAGNAALVDKPAGASLEGYLYPDSFQKTADTSPSTIVAASLAEMADHLTPELRDAFAAQGLSTHQAITLASVVEKEVASQDDRNIVAQIFLKRMKQGMPLQSDVTVLYGSIQGGQNPPTLTYDSPYNTFTHTGLPVGPINNVNASGLKAVAHPANTDYLYFVAGDDGKTYFAHTDAEHEANVKQYCKKLCAQ